MAELKRLIGNKHGLYDTGRCKVMVVEIQGLMLHRVQRTSVCSLVGLIPGNQTGVQQEKLHRLLLVNYSRMVITFQILFGFGTVSK